MVGGTLCTDLHGSIPEERMRNGICVLKRTHRRPMPVSRSMCVCVRVCCWTCSHVFHRTSTNCLEVHMTKNPHSNFLGVALSERSGNDRSRYRDLSLSRSGTGQTQGCWVAKFLGLWCRKLRNPMIIKHDLSI